MTAKKGVITEYKPVPHAECWGHDTDRMCSDGVFYCSFFGANGCKHTMFYCMNHIIYLNTVYCDTDPIVLEEWVDGSPPDINNLP